MLLKIKQENAEESVTDGRADNRTMVTPIYTYPKFEEVGGRSCIHIMYRKPFQMKDTRRNIYLQRIYFCIQAGKEDVSAFHIYLNCKPCIK
jgi:hypothetical protein